MGIRFLESHDFTNDDVVIATVVDLMSAALETGQCARDQWHVLLGPVDLNRIEQSVIGFREVRRQFLLVTRKQIDRKIIGIKKRLQRV